MFFFVVVLFFLVFGSGFRCFVCLFVFLFFNFGGGVGWFGFFFCFFECVFCL